MRVLVLHESVFGNTRTIAEAVADGVRAARPDADVDCRAVDDPDEPSEPFDLLVLGAPTHFWGLTGSVSRAMEAQYERRLMPVGAGRASTRTATATTGMRARLAALPAGAGRAAAAFDTCMSGPLTGGARAAIARTVTKAGYRLVAEPESFLVEAVAGPLREGEVERARTWGATLARALDEPTPADRRTTMRHPIHRPIDLTRVVTTAEVVVGAVLVARYLSRRPGSSKAFVAMGPGGWVSMKGGTVAVRRGSRPLSRPVPIPSLPRGSQREPAPLWARVLSAVPLQALMR